MSAKPKKPPVDWEAVERDYRAGVLTLREIGERYGCSHVAITKRAKKEGWVRDLAPKIQAKADELVTKSLVTKEVTKEAKASEKAVIEANAQAIYNVRIGHRESVQRAHALVKKLLGEVEVTTDNLDDFEKLGELLDESGPDENGTWRQDKQNEIYRKVISMPGRVDSVKKLVETLEKVVKIEREAFGLDKPEGEDPTKKRLTDAERASRLATIMARALALKAQHGEAA